jgi:hypothetical protein
MGATPIPGDLDRNTPTIRFHGFLRGKILEEWQLVRMGEPWFSALARGSD